MIVLRRARVIRVTVPQCMLAIMLVGVSACDVPSAPHTGASPTRVTPPRGATPVSTALVSSYVAQQGTMPVVAILGTQTLESKTKFAVVFVHGWSPNVTDDPQPYIDAQGAGKLPGDAYFQPLDGAIQTAFSQTPLYSFEYQSNIEYGRSGDSLFYVLDSLVSRGHVAGVIIVAHSMGGLIADWAIDRLAKHESHAVRALISLGTPHRGTHAALLPTTFWGGLLCYGVEGKLAVTPGLCTAGGQSLGWVYPLRTPVPIYAHAGNFDYQNYFPLPLYGLTGGALCFMNQSAYPEDCVNDGIVPLFSALPGFASQVAGIAYPRWNHSDLQQGYHITYVGGGRGSHQTPVFDYSLTTNVISELTSLLVVPQPT